MDLLSRLIDERKEYTNEEFREFISVIKESGRLELLKEVLGNVKEEFFVQDEIHGISHNIRVAILATYIGIQENIADEEFKLLLQAALYHDIGRKDKQKGENHGKKSAEVIEENKEKLFQNLNQEEINIIEVLCVIHSSDDEVIDGIIKRRGIANVESFMKIANILKDADALDRVRLQHFGKLKPEFLRTETSKKIVDMATELYYEDISVVDKDEPERLETRLETSEYIFLFRALTEQNVRDRNNGIRSLRTNSQVHYAETGEWKEYDDSSELTLEELYKHIRMQYKHCYTNCISLTEDPNVAKTYAVEGEQYALIRVPKNDKEATKKVIDARQIFLEELEKIIESVSLSSDKETQEMILKIENARSNIELRTIIRDQIFSLTFVNERQYLTEAKELQYHKLIAKMKLLEDRGLIGDIIPDVKNASFLSAIGNALTSAEYVHYGEIPEEMIVDCPEIFIDMFSLLGQARSNGADENTVERLTKKVTDLLQSGYDILESEDLSERDKEVLRKNSELNSNLSIENAYEMTKGRISYSEINLQIKAIQTSAEMIIRKRIILDILKKNFPEEAELLDELLKDTQCLKSGSATKQNGRGYRVSNTVNILATENGNDLDAQHIETLIQQLENFNEEQLEEIYIKGTNSKILRDLLIQLRTDEERVRQYSTKTLKTQYFAEAIVECYNRKKTGVLTPKENEKLVKKITFNVAQGDLERLYNTLQSLEVDNKKLTQKEIFAIIINIAIDGNIGEVLYNELLKLSKEEQQQVLSENSNGLQTSVVPISLSLLTGGGKAIKRLKKELIDLGIPKEFIEEKNIRNVYVAKEIVEGYNWQEVLGRELQQEEKRAILKTILKSEGLNKKGYLIRGIQKAEEKGENLQEIYSAIIKASINRSIANETAYYSTIIRGIDKLENLDLQEEDIRIKESDILKAKSQNLTEQEELVLEEELVELGMPKDIIENRTIENLYVAKEIVERYNWQKVLGRELNQVEKRSILQSILRSSKLNKTGKARFSVLIEKLEKKDLSQQEIYAVIINLGVNGKVSKQSKYDYSKMLGGQAKIEELNLEKEDIVVNQSTIFRAESQNLTEQEELVLEEELVELGIPKDIIENRTIENLYVAKEIVERYNWQDALGRELEKEEKKIIIQQILNNNSLDVRKGVYISRLVSKLEKSGIKLQETYAIIINLAIVGKVSEQAGYSYTDMLKGTSKIEDLLLKDNAKIVNQGTVLEVSEIEKEKLKNELTELEIQKDFIEEKDIRNVYMAKEIVEGYNWEEVLGRKIGLEEKKTIIQLILRNSFLNKGTSSYLSTLISKLEKKDLSQQEIYAVIMNLSINESVSKQMGYSYSSMIGGQVKIEDLELEDADITISEETMLKVSEAEQEKLQEELINLGISKELIEEKNIRNIYMAKEIVEGYNWEAVLGRKIGLEEKKAILQLILSNSGLNKKYKLYLSTLMSKLEKKDLSQQEIYAVIINLAINGKVSKQAGYSYTAMIDGTAKVEGLKLEDVDKTVSKENIAKAKMKAEKMMKKAVNKQKGKISEIPTPGELMSGLGIEQEIVQEGAIPSQIE